MRPRMLPALVVGVAAAAVSVACQTTPAAEAPQASDAGASGGSTPAAGDQGGLWDWLDGLNPFRSETRASVETGRVSERSGPDGSRQITVDLDLSRGEGPRSLLCAVTRTVPAPAGPGVAGSTADESGGATVDLITILVRDDPQRMMLIDDAPAYLVVARVRHALEPLPPSGDAVKRAGQELQSRRSYRVPPGLLDRITLGAPVQLVVSVDGREVSRTIPGAACEQIESLPRQRSGMASARRRD